MPTASASPMHWFSMPALPSLTTQQVRFCTIAGLLRC
jgi:hypothetical protein